MSDLVEPQRPQITYETDAPVSYAVADRVAWVMMDRPQFHNAQNSQMTYALDAAFRRAVDDPEVSAIVLGARASTSPPATTSALPAAT